MLRYLVTVNAEGVFGSLESDSQATALSMMRALALVLECEVSVYDNKVQKVVDSIGCVDKPSEDR